jgi:Flp pilus assembly pilin Flp
MTFDLSFLKRFVTEEDGAAAVEYAILVAVIAGAVFTAVKLFNLSSIFSQVSTSVNTIITSATAN